MQDINPDLIRMLYAKYSPDTDVDSKLEYIQQQYGDNQEEFVRNFYAKYEPNIDVDAKLEYISKAYPVKKKDETTELVSPQEEVVTTSVTEEVETPGVSDVSVSEEVVEETPEPTVDTPETSKELQHVIESKTEDKSFNEAIATVVLDDIDKDEETLVPELLEKFNKYGFSFQYAGTPGDAITVYDYDGNPLEVDLQTFTSAGKQEEYNKLIQFLNNNRRDPKKIQEDLDAEAENFKYLADREDKDTESSLLFPQVKTSKTGQITTGALGVIISLLGGGQEKEDAFVVAQRANKYITAGGEKYKQQDFDRLFEENVKALEIGDDGKPSAEAVNQAAYDAKIQQRINAQEDFINTLSPERKALAEALKAVRDAQRAGASTEDINGLKQKFNDLYNIDAKKLYNFDGTYIEEGNAPDEVVAFNNQVEEGAIEKHESYTPEELEELQVDLLYKTIFSAKKINTHADKIHEDLGYFVEGPFQALKKDVESLIDGDFYKFGKNLGTASIATDEIRKVAETGRITETLPLLPGNSPLVQEYNNNVKQLLEVQGALALNYNPSTLEEEGYFSPLKAFAVSAYEASTGQDVRVADDMVKAYVSAREDAGLKVTEKDKQRAEDSILDEGMAATGTIIPLIAEIALTKKAINLTGALKNMKVLTRYAQMQTRNPYKRLALGTISAGLQEALVFKSTGVVADQLISGSGEGMTGAMGFGFGVGGYAGGMITKALLGTRSPILQAVLSPIEKSNALRSIFNGTANATVGTGALYGAEFFDAMVNTDKGFSEAAAEVLDVGGTWEMKDGKPTYTGGNPIKKLLVSFSTMAALGLGNREGWKNIYNAMRKDIQNYKPMKPSEYAKAVETLGLDPKKQYTAEEIKKAYRTKAKENPRTKEELADPEKNKKAKEIISAYEKLTTNEGMLLEQQNIRNQEGYKKKRREMFFMANRMKNNVEFTGKEYELDYRDAEAIKDLSNTQLEVLTQDLKNQGISGQDAFNLQGKVQTARNHLKTINEVGITEPGARKRVYDLLNKFTEADRKLEELKTKAKTSKANEALFSEKIKQQEAEVKDITDNLQKEITKADKEVSVAEPTEGVLRLEGKEPVEVEPTEVKEEVVTEEVVEETPTTEVTEEVEVKTETVDNQGRPAKAGARLFNDPNPETAEISAKYKQDKGIETSAGENITELDIDNAMEIADAYEAMEDNPSNPEVQEAYNALAKETVDQYNAMTEAGYEIEIYEGKGEPYANSQEMIDDLKNNKHMYIFSTEGGFGEAGITEQQRKENAMLQDSGFKDKNGKPLLINDLFRGVHDFFGHSERGNGFGAKGEENAWDVHARMFTDKARRAMTAETRGQNSWVNFGPQMRNEKGDIIKKGEPGYLGPRERAFAPQKMGLLPESYSEITETPTTEVTEKVDKQIEEIDKKLNEKVTKTVEVSGNSRVSESDYDFYSSPTLNETKVKKESSLLMFKRTGENTAEFEFVPSIIESSLQDSSNNIDPFAETTKNSEISTYELQQGLVSDRKNLDIEIVKPGKVRKNADGKYEVVEKAQIRITRNAPGTSFKNRTTKSKQTKTVEELKYQGEERKKLEEQKKAILSKKQTVEKTQVTEEVVEEKPKVEKEFPKPKMIKTINKIIKSVVKPKIKKDGKPAVRLSIKSQIKLYEVAATLEGLDLKEMPIEQVKVLYDNILAIEKQGRVDKQLSDRAKNIARAKRKGAVAEGLYEEGPVKEKGVELNSIKEAEDFLDKAESGDRLIIINGSLATSKNNLKLFLEANPDIPIENIKGYETLTMTRVKRNKPIPSKIKKGAALIFDPTKSVANIRTQLMRIGKGSSKLKKITEDILDDITTNNPYEVEVLTEQLYKKYEKTFTDNFRSKKEANKYLDKMAKGLFKNSDTQMSNGTVVDLYIEEIIHKERAKFFREKASKEKSEKEKKALLRDADRMDRILEISDIDSKAFNEYVEKNPKIKKVANSLLDFYESNTELFRPLIEAETGMPIRTKKYYPTYRNDESLENKEYKQVNIEELTNPEVQFFNRSAMTDRLKFKDERTTKKLKTNVDARLKAQDYIHNMVHAQVYLPTARKVNELFGPVTRGKIYEKIGPVNFKYTQENLDYIIDPKLSNPYDQALKVANKLNRLGITLQLGFSLGNITKQVTSLTHYAFVGGKDGISPQDWAAAGTEMLFNKEYRDVIVKIISSKYVRDRIRKSNIDPDLKIEADKALSSTPEKVWNFYQQVAMSPITLGDIGGVLLGGLPFTVAKYKKVKTTPKGEFDEKAYIEAYKRFRTESSEAQQSSAEFTMSAAQRNQAMKLLLTYRTAQTQAFNKSMQGWIDMTDKSNESKDRWDGFKRWAYFSTSGIWFQAVANGALFAMVFGVSGDEEKKEKSREQITYDSLSGGLESYIQGMGGVAYLPQVIINLAKGRPPSFNLPPLASKFFQAGGLGMTLAKMVLDQKSWDDLTEDEKKSVSNLLFKKGTEIIKAVSEGEPGKIIEMLLNKGKDYGDPSFETLINGKPFQIKEFKTIPVVKKDKESSNEMEGFDYADIEVSDF